MIKDVFNEFNDRTSNNYQNEVSQLKALNQKLVSQNCDLQDQMETWNQKQRLDLALGNYNTANAKKFESLVQNSSNAYWMKRLNKHMSELKNKYESEIRQIKTSFTNQVEDLNWTLSSTSQELVRHTSESTHQILQLRNDISVLEEELSLSELAKSKAEMSRCKMQTEFKKIHEILVKVGIDFEHHRWRRSELKPQLRTKTLSKTTLS